MSGDAALGGAPDDRKVIEEGEKGTQVLHYRWEGVQNGATTTYLIVPSPGLLVIVQTQRANEENCVTLGVVESQMHVRGREGKIYLHVTSSLVTVYDRATAEVLNHKPHLLTLTGKAAEWFSSIYGELVKTTQLPLTRAERSPKKP